MSDERDSPHPVDMLDCPTDAVHHDLGTGRPARTARNPEATMPEPRQEPWAYYQRKGLSEMRPYVFKEPLDDISVSAYDLAAILRADSDGPGPGGYIARNPKDHTDQWYVAQAYFDDNLEPVVKRDDRATLVKALEALLTSIDDNDGVARTWAKEGARAALAAAGEGEA